MNGLYLVAPHGSLIHSGEKTSIATNRRYPIVGERLLCSRESGSDLAFGIAHVGDPAVLDIPSFDSQVSSHQVTKSARKKWWPDADKLYSYPINSYQPFPSPISIQIEPGTTLDMGEVSFPEVGEAIKSIKPELVIMSSSDRIKETEEEAMPWTTDDPPRPAKNWTAAEKKKCVSAANAALKEDSEDEQGAIFACIRAAGKTQHPGGKKGVHPDDYVIAEDLIRGFLQNEVKVGDMGDGDTHTCTCPSCGTEVEKEKGSPCREEECPKCGARMRGGDEDTESKGEEDALDISSNEDQPSPTDAPSPLQESPDDDKAGRRINSSILDKLKKLFSQLEEVIKWGDNKPDDVVGQIVSQVGKAYSFKSLGGDWFIIWPTNTYQDRDGEFFTSAALKNFVDRHEADEIKGEAWFWHVPGSKFGTIYHQAVVEENFLPQLGKYDDTPVGKAMKSFFSKYPDGHPRIAPWGWGASHGYAYVQADREQDGTYNWFDIKESTVLPVHYAANPFNPSPRAFKEVADMNDKQKEAFDEIGKLVGVPDLVDQITAAARLKKEELDGKVEHKSVKEEGMEKDPKKKPDEDEEEQVPDEKKDTDESPTATQVAPSLTPEVVAAIADMLTPAITGPEQEKSTEEEVKPEVSQITKEVVDSLQLGNLSESISTLVNEVKEMKVRLDQVEQADAEKVKAQVDAAPRFAWFQASQAQETVQNPSNASVQKGLPDAVKAIAGRIEDSI